MAGAIALPASRDDDNAPLEGSMLWVAAIVLACANFMSILDLTIANVSLPNIAGGLAATSSQGTWIVTSYAVAEAIVVPLTGWLAARFGTVRVFITAMGMFGLLSALCGMAQTLAMIIAARILQGMAGGLLMPLSQTLLLRIFPKEKAGVAITLWSMTTLIAPILGPLLGGWLCDTLSWPWIFYINLPLSMVCLVFAGRLLNRYETPLMPTPIDVVGLGLLILWVGALQLMLDLGKELDWFSSNEIIVLALTAGLGFLAFLLWELTEEHPVVDLRVFRHRGFTAAVITMSLGYGSIFALNVLTPLWLQTNMDYTAGNSGQTTAWTAVASICIAPLVARFSVKFDRRYLISGGVVWIGLVTLLRVDGTTDMAYWDIAWPLLIMGLGNPFFFICLMGLALTSVEPVETASAAGLTNFFRTIFGAFGVSLMTTVWENRAIVVHAELVGAIDPAHEGMQALQGIGVTGDAANAVVDRLLSTQSVMIATNDMMLYVAMTFLAAAAAIWLAPKPKR